MRELEAKAPLETSGDPERHTSLDPSDWRDFSRNAHEILDDLIAHVESIRQRSVWQPAPEGTRARFTRPLPREGRPIADVLDDVRAHIVPFATGNLHPRFMGWVQGAGTPIGMLAELISAGLNMNCGGRDHIGIEVEQQIVRWLREAFDYPEDATGLFLTGSSMANFLATVIAKVDAIGDTTRETGLRSAPRDLIAYTSKASHGCIAQAMQVSGIGSANLRLVDVDASGALRTDILQDMIAIDRTNGRQPFLIVATAGTVNTGAIDPLPEISMIAEREGLWFHVDGAIGALAIFSDKLRHLVKGIERSHSIALDFHKCGQVPYDAGFLLVRKGEVHKRAFAQSSSYLQRADRGLPAGETWPCDLGVDLSRGFRALKTWMTIETLGAERLGASIAHTCKLADYLAKCVRQSKALELCAQPTLNIVCFRVRGADDSINRELVLDLHESGIAAPSWTEIDGKCVIRCAIINHRTTRGDIDIFLSALESLLEKRLNGA